MPKKIEIYQCEICGSRYKDENYAIECERYHIRVSAVHDETYCPSGKFPYSVHLKMSDGSLIKYNMDDAYKHLMRVGNTWGRKI